MSASDDGEQYEVEAILDDRIGKNGCQKFRIRWKGYTPADDTWEKRANLDCPDLLKAYEDAKAEKKKKAKSTPTVKKVNKRRRNTSSTIDEAPTMDMEGVFDKAPATPPPISEEEMAAAIPPPKKKSKPNEEEKVASPCKEKHKKKSRRNRSESRDPDEPSTSPKSKKKDKKKKKDKHRDEGESGGTAESSSKKAKHKKKESTDASSSKKKNSKKDKEKEQSDGSSNNEKPASLSPENTARVPPLIIIMGESSSGAPQDKSSSPNDNEDANESPLKTESENDDNSNENPATCTIETFTCSLTPPSSSPSSVLETSTIPSHNPSSLNTSISNQMPNSSSAISLSLIPNSPSPVKTETSELTEGLPAPSIVINIENAFGSAKAVVNEIVNASDQANGAVHTETNNIDSVTSGKQSSPSETSSTNSPISKSPNLLPVETIATSIVVSEQPSSVNSVINNDLPSAPNLHAVAAESAEQRTSPESEAPRLTPMSPIQHTCFGNSPTVSEFAKNADIRNINHNKIMYVLAKIWKLRCPECIQNYSITDDIVEYAFALLLYESKEYFMVKIKNCLNQLFLIEATLFKGSCPNKFSNFVNDTRNYFDTVGDVGMAIDVQKAIVDSHHKKDGILYHFNHNDQATFQHTPISYNDERVRKARRDIVALFNLELQLELGIRMAKTVDFADLQTIAMQYYHRREPMYAMVKPEFVIQVFEPAYFRLIPKPSNL